MTTAVFDSKQQVELDGNLSEGLLISFEQTFTFTFALLLQMPSKGLKKVQFEATTRLSKTKFTFWKWKRLLKMKTLV